MAFKYIKSETANFSTPQEMFQDNKMKNILGLIDYQSKMIDNYMNSIRDDGTIIDKHVAFELPTGSGKTLIGLLIGEFHRRKYHRKVLFLCPTKQLVAQVCYQAKTNYGINVIEFIGKILKCHAAAPSDPSAFPPPSRRPRPRPGHTARPDAPAAFPEAAAPGRSAPPGRSFSHTGGGCPPPGG